MINNNFPFEALFVTFVAVIAITLVIDIAALVSRIKRSNRVRRFWSRMLNKLTHKRKIKNLARTAYTYYLIPLNIFAILFAVVAYQDMFVKPLGVNFHIPEMDAVWTDPKQPFTIQFDRPLNTDKLNTEFFLSDSDQLIKGRWDLYDLGISAFKRKLVFTPEHSFLPNRDIGIYISGISNLAQQNQPWDKLIDLKSPRVPKISSTVPEDGSRDLGVDQEVIINLDQPDGDHISWEVKVTPEAQFELIRTPASNQMRIKFAKVLTQGATYKINFRKVPRMYDIATGETLISEESLADRELTFTTVKGSSIKGFKPTGESVLVDTTIEMEFDYDMDPTEVQTKLKLQPEFKYAANWVSPRKLLIKPEKLEKDTTYTLTLPKGLKNMKGGVSEADVVYSFKTIGKVAVTGFSPSNGAGGRSVGTRISVSFNQEVDHGSAQSKFSISPSVAGSFSWSGNTVTFKPNSSLGYLTRYTVKVARGVKTINGLDSDQDFGSSFTTESQVFSLNVPSYRQPSRFACNLTAASMALAYRGVSVSPSSIYSQIPKASPTAYDSGSNTWGDPNSGFVGTLDGSGPSGPNGAGGYGVYWGPIRSFIAKYRSASTKSYPSTSAMLKDVAAGNPVIVWAHNGFSGSGTRVSWNKPGGGTVSGVKGMHSYVVRGFIGSADNPSSVLVNDPGTRGRWTVSIGYFNSLFNTFGRTGVVVY